MDSTLVITTGGTIGALPYPDPINPPLFATMPELGHDLVRDYLEKNFSNRVRCLSLQPRDSQYIDTQYRSNLLSLSLAASEPRVVITHGTDTILTTAGFFYTHLAALKGKRIILTGAMTPLSNGPQSDGHRNLAYALESKTNNRVGIVLSDFNTRGLWTPRLYSFKPNRFEKDRTGDGRYYRLRTPRNSTSLST